MLAATESLDLARLLLDLLIVLAAAKLAAELAERLKIPAVLGEIAAGIAIGPSALGLVELGGERGVSLSVLAEIGVLLLLLSVGMEMDLGELGKVGAVSMAVAVVGVVVPFAGGTGLGLALGQDTNAAVFIGAALTATSVGITARVFGDLRALATIEARIVLGAAVADDVLGLIILTVVVKVVTGGEVGVGTVAETLGLAVAFLVGTGLIGVFVVPRVFRALGKVVSSGGTLVVAGFALMVAFAELADSAKLAFIIGAFMAGLALGRTDHHERIATDLGAVSNVLVPVFFVSIGINADLAAMGKPSVIWVALLFTAVAVVGKLAAGVAVRGSRADRVLIGIGMLPRGEVGLIFASIGLSNAVLDADQYGTLLIVILLTTVMTPPLLRWRLGRTADVVDDAGEPEPTDGWVEVDDGVVVLRGTPPVSATVPVALAVAQELPGAEPASDVLDWFAAHRTAPLEWRSDDTPALVGLLRNDEPRAWRFLDVSGVLERALPEVAGAMARRRADMTDLDPLGALRFSTVDRLHDLVTAEGGSPVGEHLALAALAADVGDSADAGEALARRLVSDVEARRVAALVDDARTFRRRAHDTAGVDEAEVLQFAIHLGSAAHARDAHLLARAFGELTSGQNERLDALADLVLAALDHPEISGSDATNLAGARLAAAQHLLTDEAPIERLQHASTVQLLTHEPEVLARQARLIEPLPRPGTVRVAVSPQPEPGLWRIDIACRDTDALLARLSDGLDELGLAVARADVATWPDGGVVDSFVVSAAERPAAREIGAVLERRLRKPVSSGAPRDLTIRFDNGALPWHTVCVVSGADAPGTLAAIAHAFAAADVVVHSARLTSDGGVIDDRFTVSDRFNRKLDERRIERVRVVLATGGAGRRTR
jgi:Kef-type K+ transport system membrane component KefB